MATRGRCRASSPRGPIRRLTIRRVRPRNAAAGSAGRDSANRAIRSLMALRIETFSNVKGGDAFFKAIGHPLALAGARDLIARLAKSGPVAIYDPLGLVDAFASIHDLSSVALAGVFVQTVDAI